MCLWCRASFLGSKSESLLLVASRKAACKTCTQYCRAQLSKLGSQTDFFAITDRDFDVTGQAQEGTHVLSWGTYHIENFLLSPKYMLVAIGRVAPDSPLKDEGAVIAALKAVADANVDGLVLQRLQKIVNDKLVRSIAIGGNPTTEPVTGLLPSIKASLDRFDTAKADVGDETWLRARADEYRAELRKTLDDGTWPEQFPGRPILTGFVQQHLTGKLSYEGFVNLVIDAMVEANYKPPGMVEVLSQIVPDP